MIDIFLANAARPSSIAPMLLTLIIIGAYVFIFALIIITLIRVSRYFRNAGKEQKLLRLELGKLADEVHQIRQEMKDDKSRHSHTVN
ncbi:MAG: hypothetical protein P8016_06595 [Sedimentisphaerales bacterium]|jgi:hypothetical protein